MYLKLSNICFFSTKSTVFQFYTHLSSSILQLLVLRVSFSKSLFQQVVYGTASLYFWDFQNRDFSMIVEIVGDLFKTFEGKQALLQCISSDSKMTKGISLERCTEKNQGQISIFYLNFSFFKVTMQKYFMSDFCLMNFVWLNEKIKEILGLHLNLLQET